MIYLLAEVVSIALFVGFIIFASYEQRAGRIFLLPEREQLDKKIKKAFFICNHVDLLAFLKDSVQILFERSLHYVASFALRAVRFIERHLNSFVRVISEKFSLYNPSSGHPTTPSKSQFIQSISSYKEELKKDKDSHELNN